MRPKSILNSVKKVRVFCDSASYHGGTPVNSASSGTGRHVTAVIGVSGSGKLCPPFFIVQGKQVMTSWLEPLNPDDFKRADAKLISALSRRDWFPRDGAIYCTKKRSMEMDIMPRFIDHCNNFVRKDLPEEEHFLVTMDGHGSRKGIQWIEKCVELNCEADLAPANTLHLQPCDQDINKRFQMEIRAVRDELACHGMIDARSIRFKLMCANIAHSRITVMDIVKSFCVTGIFPFNRSFAERFRGRVIEITDDHKDDEEDGASPLQPEERTVREVEGVLQSAEDAAWKLQRLSILLQDRTTTNSIVMKLALVRGTGLSGKNNKSNANVQNSVPLFSGAGAEYVTICEALAQRRETEAAKIMEAEEKEKTRKEKEAKSLEAKEAKAAAKRAREEDHLLRKSEKPRVAMDKRNVRRVKNVPENIREEVFHQNPTADRHDSVCPGGGGDMFCTSVGMVASSPTKSPARKILGRIHKD